MNRLVRQVLPYASDAGIWLSACEAAPHRVFLDSARPHGERGRYDIISADPKTVINLKTIPCNKEIEFIEQLSGEIGQAMAGMRSCNDLPFCGGAIGLLSYELGEALQIRRPQASKQVDFIGIYDWAIVIDHLRQSAELVIQPGCESRFAQQLLALSECEHAQAHANAAFHLGQKFQSSMDARRYHQQFQRLQDYIRAGDCYQVNLTREFVAPFSGEPLSAYLALREVAAAPFSAFLDLGHAQLLSLSPERFIAVNELGQLRTEPIKGTAARSLDPGQDRQLAQNLLNSAKNRAENVMIVDLLRNDLGRCCVPGSIQAEPLLELQSFRTVHHLVSTVTGQLRDNCSPLAALLRCFPGGSITGAPKRRAMEIIAELEPHRRAAYCGSVFYLSASGRMDSSIVIRSFLCANGEIRGWSGGGIVADSDWEEELMETQEKLGKLLKLLESI